MLPKRKPSLKDKLAAQAEEEKKAVKEVSKVKKVEAKPRKKK